MTLLFAFFVVMFASSQTDKSRAQQVSDSVNEALSKGGVASAVHEILGGTVDDKGKGNAQMKGPGGSEKSTAARNVELMPSMQLLTKTLEEEIRQGKIDMHMEPRGLVISLREASFFPSGGDTIDPAAFGSVDKIAAMLHELPNPVRLEGHTDSQPIHTSRFRSNWELSAARAIAMMQTLSTRCNVTADRMAIAGYGETVPIDSNDTADGRARNRRVDIVVLSLKAQLSEPAQPAGKAKPEESGKTGTASHGAPAKAEAAKAETPAQKK